MRVIVILLIFPLIFDCHENKSDFNIERLIKISKQVIGDKGTIIYINTKSGKVEGIINEDLAFKRAVTPGSTFKLVTALGSLHKSISNLRYKVYCNDKYYLIGPGPINRRINYHILKANIGDYYRCSIYKGHKTIDFRNAINKSCNYYFWNLGERLGYNSFFETVVDLGFGKKVFQGLPDENPGMIKKESTRTRQVLGYIGEGGKLLVTPLQMAFFIHYIASEGKTKRIYLYKNKNKYISRKIDTENKYINLIPHIKDGLIREVSTSTDFSKIINNFNNFAGKTGTATRGKNHQTYGWFIGYSPIHEPKIAFALFLKNASGKKALKITTKILFNY
jgi:penicillin-binding protein 2